MFEVSFREKYYHGYGLETPALEIATDDIEMIYVIKEYLEGVACSHGVNKEYNKAAKVYESLNDVEKALNDYKKFVEETSEEKQGE